MPDPTAPYFETALYHQSSSDHACWIYYTVENPPASGQPTIRSFAWGRMKYAFIAPDGTQRIYFTTFGVMGAPYTFSTYPPVDTTVGVQVKPPAPPYPPAGYRAMRLGVYYDGAVVLDENTKASAVATYDPAWGEQPPL